MSSTTSNNGAATILVRSGIGGAGNYRTSKADKTSTRTMKPIAPKTFGYFSSGIGGAGNSHLVSESTRISHEESLRRERVRQYATPTNYHLGIGGAGNTQSRSTSPNASVASSSASQRTVSSANTSDSIVRKFRNSVAESWHRRNERISLYEAYNGKLPAYPGLFPSSADKAFLTANKAEVYASKKAMDSTDTLVSHDSTSTKKAWKVAHYEKVEV